MKAKKAKKVKFPQDIAILISGPPVTESVICWTVIRLSFLQSCALSPNYCFSFALHNRFIRLSYKFGGIWRYNIEIRLANVWYFGGLT